MAQMVPSTVPEKASPGEKLVFNTLRDFTPPDWIIYYETRVQDFCPDFILIIPEKGVLILEVKGQNRRNILRTNYNYWTVRNYNKAERRFEDEPSVIKNPLKQARDYSFAVKETLSAYEALKTNTGRGKYLRIRYDHAVVLTGVTTLEMLEQEVDRSISPDRLFSRDDFQTDSNNFDRDRLVSKLRGVFKYDSDKPLTEEEVNAVRFALYPESRLGQTRTYEERNLLALSDMKTMSLYQESLARQIGEGHRILRGVAGSGKTLILIARGKLLAKQHPDWKILYLTYTSVLANFLRESFKDDPSYSNVEVSKFVDFLKVNHGTRQFDRIPKLLELAQEGRLRVSNVYDAIIIDEAQDWEGQWVDLVIESLNPNTFSLLISEDRAQDIFKRKGSLTRNVRLNFSGRSRILRINYRNTRQILSYSWNFYKALVSERSEDIVEPESANRNGPAPEFWRFDTSAKEYEWLAGQVEQLLYSGATLSEIAVLYRGNGIRYLYPSQVVKEALDKRGIPSVWVSANKESKDQYSAEMEAVKVITMASAKGLDFKHVFIVSAETCPHPTEQDKDSEFSTFYMAMTRATDRLFISASGESEVVDYFNSLRRLSVF